MALAKTQVQFLKRLLPPSRQKPSDEGNLQQEVVFMYNLNEFEKSKLGEDILIGKRIDGSMFWLKKSDVPNEDKCEIIEGGPIRIDKEIKTTFFGFPIADPKTLYSLESEFYNHKGAAYDYTDTEFFVHLSHCQLRTSGGEYKNNFNANLYHHKLKSGYILDSDTFVLFDQNTSEPFWMKYTTYSQNDFYTDRFGWFKALKRCFPDISDDKLYSDIVENEFVKESYGDVWIEKNSDVLILGPVKFETPDLFDEYHCEHLSELNKSLPFWNETKYWLETEPQLKINPVNSKMFFLRGLCRLISD
jgi:hypothetical protein